LLGELGSDGGFTAGGVGEAAVLFPLAHVVEADDGGGRHVGVGATGGFSGGASAARQPILSAQLVEDGATDAHAHVPLEALGRTIGVTADCVPQTAHAGGDQILTQHVARQLALEATGDLTNEGLVLKEQLGAQVRVETARLLGAGAARGDDGGGRGSSRPVGGAGRRGGVAAGRARRDRGTRHGAQQGRGNHRGAGRQRGPAGLRGRDRGAGRKLGRRFGDASALRFRRLGAGLVSYGHCWLSLRCASAYCSARASQKLSEISAKTPMWAKLRGG